jgi:hypothetical protein
MISFDRAKGILKCKCGKELNPHGHLVRQGRCTNIDTHFDSASHIRNIPRSMRAKKPIDRSAGMFRYIRQQPSSR